MRPVNERSPAKTKDIFADFGPEELAAFWEKLEPKGRSC
jgi:hypothetical protein